jgi:AraC-like DNA-binding protein
MEMDNPLEIQYRENYTGMEMKNHFHNSYEVIFVIEGKAEFKINEKKYTVGRNDILFVSNLENHELKVLELPYKRYFILIKPDSFHSLITNPILASIFKYRPESFEHVIPLNAEKKLQVSDIIQRMLDEYARKVDFWEATLESYLQLLLVSLYRSYKQYFPLKTLNQSTNTILEIQKYIDEHFMEAISLEEISKLFYTDMYYLSHLFKKVTGFNFKDYIILQRISKAKDLLFYTSDDVTTVGLNSGFNNVNHFIRIFKKYAGTTPYQYRKMHANL